MIIIVVIVLIEHGRLTLTVCFGPPHHGTLVRQLSTRQTPPTLTRSLFQVFCEFSTEYSGFVYETGMRSALKVPSIPEFDTLVFVAWYCAGLCLHSGGRFHY